MPEVKNIYCNAHARRKTWYGTHSKPGAANAVMFSIVESCKINPRDYFREIVHAIHEKRTIFALNEYLNIKSEKSGRSLQGKSTIYCLEPFSMASIIINRNGYQFFK